MDTSTAANDAQQAMMKRMLATNTDDPKARKHKLNHEFICADRQAAVMDRQGATVGRENAREKRDNEH